MILLVIAIVVMITIGLHWYFKQRRSSGPSPTPVNLPMIPKPSPLCDNEKLACMTVYKPVCGTNRKTYSNACMARRECVDVAYEGSC